MDGVGETVRSLDRDLRETDVEVVVLSGEQLETTGPADVILLRLSNQDPGRSCRSLRRQGHRWIMALTPHDSTADRIRLLDAGADACVATSQPRSEIIARIRSLLRLA